MTHLGLEVCLGVVSGTDCAVVPAGADLGQALAVLSLPAAIVKGKHWHVLVPAPGRIHQYEGGFSTHICSVQLELSAQENWRLEPAPATVCLLQVRI